MKTTSTHLALCLLAVSLVACSKDEASSSSPGPERPNKGVSGAPPHFSFEGNTDALSVALTDLAAGYNAAPRSQQELDVLLEKTRAAALVLEANAEPAASLLIDEYEGLDRADHQGRLALVHLLGTTNSETALSYLYVLATKTPPDFGEEDFDEATTEANAARLVRLHAVAQIGRMARANGGGKEILLDLAASGNSDVGQAAISAYFGVVPERYKARRDLMRRLAPEDRYLAYKLF